MKSHTVYRTFRTEQRREFVRITEEVEEAVREAGIAEGMVLVAAMHITAAVWINDDEPGIQTDTLEWLDKLAPPSWKAPENEVARELLPDPGDYRHHRGGGEEIGDGCSYAVGDIRQPDGQLRLVSAVLERHDKLDFLLNNAGGQYFVPAEAIAQKGWRSVQRLNVEGTLGMCRAALELAMGPG